MASNLVPDAEQIENREAKIREILSEDPDRFAYAVLDGASVEGLLSKLEQFKPEYACLYRGDLSEDAGLAEAAPYLIKIEPDTELLTWLLSEGWGHHWGVYALSSAGLKEVRKHFRTFLMVKGPDGENLYFRFYDPRVLRVFLPTCTPSELAVVFGPVVQYLMEDVDGSLVVAQAQDGRLRKVLSE